MTNGNTNGNVQLIIKDQVSNSLSETVDKLEKNLK